MSKSEITTKNKCIPKLLFYWELLSQKTEETHWQPWEWFLVLGSMPTSPSLQVSRVSLSNHSRDTNGASLYFTPSYL